MSFLFHSGAGAALLLAMAMLAASVAVSWAIPFPRRPENRQRVLRANFAFWACSMVLTGSWAISGLV